MSTARKSSRKTSGLWPTPKERDFRTAQGGWTQDLSVTVAQSIQTFEPLTEPPTEAQLYLPGGFHASHFPKPGSEEVRKMTVTSGRKCSGLYKKPGPLGLLVKTLLESST